MRHSASAVYVHAVWATWDRLPLLEGEVERCAYRAIGATCTRLGAEVIALGGVVDHVHLLLRLPVTISIAELVGKVKGATSHLITHEVLTDGSFFKWQGSYGVVSVSPRHVSLVAEYVTHQAEHHALGSLRPGFEPLPARAGQEAARSQPSVVTVDAGG